MKYLNAEDILPNHLIREIQNYVAGGYVYIPALDGKKAWGTSTGIRRELAARNQQICEAYAAGQSVKALAARSRRFSLDALTEAFLLCASRADAMPAAGPASPEAIPPIIAQSASF